MTTPTLPSLGTAPSAQSFSALFAPFKNLLTPPAAPASGGTPAMPSLVSSLTTKPATPAAPAAPMMSYAQPSAQNKTPAIPSTGSGYTVQGGDTLSAIAAKNGMTVQQLMAANPSITNPNVIKPGQNINLAPAKSSIQVTPAGTVVNGHTGGVVPPATPPAVAGMSTTTPAVPTVPDAGTPEAPITTPPPSPLASALYTSPEYEAALKQLTDLGQMTPEEVQNQQDLAALQASYKKAYVNTEGQPIPLEFITGENRRLQESATDLAAPLQAQATLLQAKRTLAQNAAQAKVTAEGGKVAAYRDFNKPTSVAIGTSLVNPATGSTVFGGGQSDIIGKAIADGRLTPDMVTRYGQAGILAALQLDPGYNFVTQKSSVNADSSSLTEQQKYADTVSRAYSTATANLDVLNKLVTSTGLNQSDVPLINQLNNKLKAGLTDPGAVAAFQTALTGLRAEYAQVLSRGGQVTDTARNEANALIPDNLSPKQLQQVLAQLQAEGGNAIKEANAKVTEIKNRIGSNAGSSSSSAGIGSTVVKTKVGNLDLTTW